MKTTTMTTMTTMTRNNGILINNKNRKETQFFDIVKEIQKRGILNMAALMDVYPAMYDFISKVAHEQHMNFTMNSKPVVDLFTGMVYPSMSLGYIKPSIITKVNRMIHDSINYSKPFGAIKEYQNVEIVTTDNLGREIFGHQFMDCGSMELQILEGLYNGFKAQQKKNEKEAYKKFILTHKVSVMEEQLKLMAENLKEMKEIIEV